MKRRNTPTKRAVLALLTESGTAMCRDTIEERITVKINRATIYRILNQFCEDEILCRIVAENGKQYFAIRNMEKSLDADDIHFHFRCLKCQQVECLPMPAAMPTPQGYVLKEANCVLSG
ncbi:MAG: transcriptional repressor, partial [Bacteroidota bacterium]